MTTLNTFERTSTLMQRKFNKYLLPTVLTTIAIYTSGVVDSIMVGNLLSEAALSATGLTMPIIYIMNAFFMIFAIGGSTFASITNGQRDKEKVNRVFTTTYVVGLTVAFAFAFTVLLFAHPISNMLAKGEPQLAKMCRDYFIPIAFNCPVLLIVLGMAYFVRIEGKPKVAAQIVIISNFANLVLLYVFIKIFNWGMLGAGLSTVVGYCIGFVVLVPYFLSKNRSLFFVKPCRKGLKLLPRILGIGTPKALMLCLSFLRFLALNALIMATLGKNGMIAMTVCLNALMLASMFINGTMDTLLPIVGTLFGEKDYKGIFFSMRTGLKFMFIACFLVITGLLVFPEAIGRIFGIQSAEALSIVSSALRMYAFSLLLYGVNIMLHNFYTTTGRAKLSSLIVILNGFVFVLFFAFVLSRYNSNYIWMAFLLSEAATLLVVLLVGKFIRKKEAVTGVLLLNQKTDSKSLDLTIPATIESAVGLSDFVVAELASVLSDKSSLLKIGIAIEEMAVNIAKYGHKKKQGFIDLLVRITDEETILRIRDDGIPFDPTLYTTNEINDFAIGGIEVVRRLAKNIVYSRQLGFNISIITLSKGV